MKFSVCIDCLFSGGDFLSAMNTVKESGLSAYEFWSWRNKDLNAIRRRQEELSLTPAAFCTKFTSLVDPAERTSYLEGLKQSIEAANLLSCRTLITQVGNTIPGVTRERQTDSLIEGLSACVPLLKDAGITLVFEPLNTKVDHRGYFLTSSEEALAVAEQVDSPYVSILFDLYHQQIMEGDLTANALKLLPHIGHIHCAGNPGRNELDTGEIRYETIFSALNGAGYSGFLGLEYRPTRDILPELKRIAETEKSFS